MIFDLQPLIIPLGIAFVSNIILMVFYVATRVQAPPIKDFWGLSSALSALCIGIYFFYSLIFSDDIHSVLERFQIVLITAMGMSIVFSLSSLFEKLLYIFSKK